MPSFTNSQHPETTPTQAARRRWQRSQRITAALLVVWLGVSFGAPYFAREWSGQLQGWPISFWVAAQGAVLVYIGLVALHARLVHRLDVDHNLAEDD